jgi:homoserine dehydrogenase
MVLSIAIIGPGLVGSEFISQIAAHQLKSLTNPSLPKLPIIGITNSKKLLIPPTPQSELSLSSWSVDLQNSSHASNLDTLIDYAVSRSPAVIVDCTSSDSVAAKYPAWLKKGLHIVTPNKKGFSGDLGLYQSIKELSKFTPSARTPFVFHESTVGYVQNMNMPNLSKTTT